MNKISFCFLKCELFNVWEEGGGGGIERKQKSAANDINEYAEDRGDEIKTRNIGGPEGVVGGKDTLNSDW